MTTTPPLHDQPAALLQHLIRFDTTNPPGDEAACIAFIADQLRAVGIEPQLYAHTPNRPNLVARLKGAGTAPPLLLYGHVDVVTTKNQDWQHPPFSGDVIDGYIWGRGALDMKGGVAMMVAAFMRAHVAQLPLAGDVILCVLADEEALGVFGARYMVEEHADLFAGVKYAIGEFGGFTLEVSGQRFYPIMVAEKQSAKVVARVRGPGGHGSLPMRGGTMAKLGQFLTRLDKTQLPLHVTDAARLMFNGMADGVGGLTGTVLRQLTNPLLSNSVLRLLGDRATVFEPLLRHTVNATIVDGGTKFNVIPSEVEVALDTRLLPGFTPDDFLREFAPRVGPDVALEVVDYSPGPATIDMRHFDMLAGVLREADPDGYPVPLLLGGVTDGRLFAQLGIQTYGFLPMQLPNEMNFAQLVHAANERIPADTVAFGTDAIYTALGRYGRD